MLNPGTAAASLLDAASNMTAFMALFCSSDTFGSAAFLTPQTDKQR